MTKSGGKHKKTTMAHSFFFTGVQSSGGLLSLGTIAVLVYKRCSDHSNKVYAVKNGHRIRNYHVAILQYRRFCKKLALIVLS